jgi:ABC-type dipeptide/oligopeptide/nickel transport system permease component
MFLVRRILTAIPALFGILTITFFLLSLVPGDPVDLMLGEQASSIDKDSLRHDLGLDQPIATRYVSFLKKTVSADLGVSFTSRKSVFSEIRTRFPATAELAVTSMLLALLFGIPLGVFAAINKNHAIDHLVRVFTLTGTSLPSFWIGPFLVYVFALKLDWLPVSERGGLDHLLLPAVTLALGLTAVLAQVTRAAMLEIMNDDFVRTAKAKGASQSRIYFRHALANAAIPIITVSALQFGAVLTGTVIVETIFDWPGLGTLLFQAIQNRDYPVIQATVLVIALTYAGVNLVADLLYAVANPKVRLT